MVVMASDGPSPHSPSLYLGLTAQRPSRRHHAQSLLGPSFHDPTTPHKVEKKKKKHWGENDPFPSGVPQWGKQLIKPGWPRFN